MSKQAIGTILVIGASIGVAALAMWLEAHGYRPRM